MSEHMAPMASSEPLLRRFADEDLLGLQEVHEISGYTKATLYSYSSYQSKGVMRGPRVTRVPGSRAILFRWSDVRDWMAERAGAR